MRIGVQANLPGGALTQVALPSPAPFCAAVSSSRAKGRAGSGQKWVATLPGAPHS